MTTRRNLLIGAASLAVLGAVRARAEPILTDDGLYKRRLATDDAFAEKLQAAGRTWVEENYDAHKNAARLRAHMLRALAQT